MLGSHGAGTSPCRRLHGESMAEAVGGGKMPPWLSPAAGAMPAALWAEPPSVVGEGGLLGPWSVTEGSVSEAAARGVDSVAEPKPICSPRGRAGAGRVKARDYPKCEEVLRPGLSRAG